MHHQREDNIILSKFLNREPDALDTLFDAYYKPLCLYSVQITEDLFQSEDIVQELFIDFWEKRRYRNIATGLRAYLFRAVRNESVRISKKLNRHPLLDELEELAYSPIDDKYDDEDLQMRNKRILAALEELSPQEYTVLREIIFNGKRYKEVAAGLDISVNTVKTHMMRAMKILRKKSLFLFFYPFF